jgi:hypothetical protein
MQLRTAGAWRKARWLVFALALLVGVVTIAALEADQPFGLPPLVVHDAAGQVVGQFVGVDSDSPIVLLKDESDAVFLSASRDYLSTATPLLFFNDDCTTDFHYLPTPDDPSPFFGGSFRAMLGVSYAVGPGDLSGDLGKLYRSFGDPLAVNIKSAWVSQNPEGSRCHTGAPFPATMMVVQGSVIADLEVLFDAPFGLQY